MAEGVKFPDKIPVNDVAKRRQPASQIRFIKGGLPRENSGHILCVPRTTGHKLVYDEIFDGGKANGYIFEDYPHGPPDGFRFIGSEREDEVDPHTGRTVAHGKDIGTLHEGRHIGYCGNQADIAHDSAHIFQIGSIDAKRDVNVARQTRLPVDQYGLSPDNHVGDSRILEGLPESSEEGLMYLH